MKSRNIVFEAVNEDDDDDDDDDDDAIKVASSRAVRARSRLGDHTRVYTRVYTRVVRLYGNRASRPITYIYIYTYTVYYLTADYGRRIAIIPRRLRLVSFRASYRRATVLPIIRR